MLFLKKQISIVLDAYFADEIIRYYAVKRISKFTDEELSLYML